MAFPETIAAAAAGRSVDATILTFMDFRDQPRRWWTGFGILRAGGQEWLGTGQMILIDGLTASIGTEANATTFTMSGVDPEVVGLVRASADRVHGRRVQVFMQFFHPPGTGEAAWQPLDAPFSIWTGVMDQLRYAADGPADRTVVLSAEGLMTNRRRPPFGRFTDGDQKARFPNDRGLEEIAGLVNKTIRWVE